MLRDREGRKLWIQTERGEFDPLESYQQIDERRKSQDGPDWWVVAKEPDWAPPKRRMSLVAGGLGGHTKPNSHGDQQPYDELGRYAGPGEGAWSEKPQEGKPRGESLLSAFLETPEGGGRDVLDERLAYRDQDKDESEYRGKARLENTLELPDWPHEGNVFPEGTDGEQTQSRGKVFLPPPPPPSKGPYLIWSQSKGTLTDQDGNLLGNGYSGKGKPGEKDAGRNDPGREGEENVGPIPRGNWVIAEVYTSEYKGLQPPVIRLKPDDATRARVKGMDRGPDSFLIHGNNDKNDASEGCVILDKPTREMLALKKRTIIHVEK